MIFVRCFDEAKRVQNFMNGVENGLYDMPSFISFSIAVPYAVSNSPRRLQNTLHVESPHFPAALVHQARSTMSAEWVPHINRPGPRRVQDLG